jgi:hypothetical protein
MLGRYGRRPTLGVDDGRRRGRRSGTGGVLTADSCRLTWDVDGIMPSWSLDRRGLTMACGRYSRPGRYGRRSVEIVV